MGAPLAGQRRLQVTARCTAVDGAHGRREGSEVPSPHAAQRVLVLAPLHPHKLASWDAAVTPAEARRWLARVERPDTPKHGSEFKRAETELSVLATQCVERRMPAPTILTQAVVAWERHRNTAQCRVDWHFTTHDARIKLKRLYPSMQLG